MGMFFAYIVHVFLEVEVDFLIECLPNQEY